MRSYRYTPRTVRSDAVGQAPQPAPVQPLTLTEKYPGLVTAYQVASVAGGALGAYHGYKRNESIGWAIGWALLGGIFPFITIPISLAQGFGEPK